MKSLSKSCFDFNSFEIKIDASYCTSLIEGCAFLDNNTYDSLIYKNQIFESGKIYGLISEYGQGCMYLSYLLGGKVNFGDLEIFCNETKLNQEDLKNVSWNLEPSKELYRKAVVKKSIEKALKNNNSNEIFADIAEKFILTPPRYDRKMYQLSGERWRASAALGYANKKKIFYAPYKPSSFYYNMCQSGLLKILRELTDNGAVVLLPAGSDDFIKYIADKCIYLNHKYDIESLKKFYLEKFNKIMFNEIED